MGPGARKRGDALDEIEDGPAGLDRVQIVDEEDEDVTIGGVEGGGLRRDFDPGIVDPVRPVEYAKDLPRVSPVRLPAMRWTALANS
jgi:hypothetical protein